MRNTDTAADTLLDDAMRMIRVDAYRLATVVDAYASCAEALQMRLMFDHTSISLPHRQEAMVEKLSEAIGRLKKVDVIRNGDEAKKWNACADSVVCDYVAEVLKKSQAVHDHLRGFSIRN
jgi:hypothetical protein